MRCKKEEFLKGEYFHIYNHSLDGILLYPEKDDYNYFIKKFKSKIQEYPASVFAYCLMPNHFHFLIRQNSEKPIFKIFNDVNNSYVKHYNFKYKRKGYLYQGDLNHKHVQNEYYLITLCQYIHHNPVKAGLVNNLEDWEYSNYLECIGKRNNGLFENELNHTHFDNSYTYEKQIKDYEKYNDEKEFTKLLFEFNVL